MLPAFDFYRLRFDMIIVPVTFVFHFGYEFGDFPNAALLNPNLSAFEWRFAFCLNFYVYSFFVYTIYFRCWICANKAFSQLQ